MFFQGVSQHNIPPDPNVLSQGPNLPEDVPLYSTVTDPNLPSQVPNTSGSISQQHNLPDSNILSEVPIVSESIPQIGSITDRNISSQVQNVSGQNQTETRDDLMSDSGSLSSDIVGLLSEFLPSANQSPPILTIPPSFAVYSVVQNRLDDLGYRQVPPNVFDEMVAMYLDGYSFDNIIARFASDLKRIQ